MYVWGSNKCRQLSSKEALHIYSPEINLDFEANSSPAAIATGDSHTLILTDSGDVYSVGRGKEGQLGLCDKADSSKPKLISSLSHETIVNVACGSQTSYAITSTGRVYQWGLVHVMSESNGTEETGGRAESTQHEAAAAGELTGLAQDQSTFVVAVDAEARIGAHQESHIGSHNEVQEPRLLRSIVRDSTERWMLANDDADREFYREMKAMGYQNEVVDEMMEQRGREYTGMLRLGCRRKPVADPAPVLCVAHERIVSVSAGYAHCMLLTDTGYLYACGYNDRGQLGLGHRISTSEFKRIDFLAGRLVLQVACGQQHTICRAVDRAAAAITTTDQLSGEGASIPGTQDTGGDAFIWGNGMLGQLGLGRRGTSKGRLLPTLIPTLHELFPGAIAHVAAGHNFTVAVSCTGIVYSWGHAEYNQHGSGSYAATDYVDPYHYFIPRPVIIKHRLAASARLSYPSYSAVRGGDVDSKKGGGSSSAGVESQAAHITHVTCGSNFSIAMDADGNLYSWGWNESGVLGHGIGHFSSAPACITTLGSHLEGKAVAALTTGAKHVLAMTESSGHKGATSFRAMLVNPRYADACLYVKSGSEENSFPCHRVILAARSRYFKGFLQALERDRDRDRDQRHGDGCDFEGDLIDLSYFPGASVATVKGLLEYIYMDNVNVPAHRKSQLADLAEAVYMTRLHTLLAAEAPVPTPPVAVGDLSGMLQLRRSFAGQPQKSFASETLHANTKKLSLGGPSEASTSNPSTFVEDMRAALLEAQFADVVFTCDVDDGCGVAGPFLAAHKVVLSQMGYFEGLFGFHSTLGSAGSSVAARKTTHLVDGELEDVDITFTTTSSTGSSTACTRISMDEFSADDIDLSTFVAVLLYAYTGEIDIHSASCIAARAVESSTTVLDDREAVLAMGETDALSIKESQEAMIALLVAANRLDFSRLAMRCERELVSNLRDDFPFCAKMENRPLNWTPTHARIALPTYDDDNNKCEIVFIRRR